jgi:biofilm PGA synthesis N-glycosyltransferase PgaC
MGFENNNLMLILFGVFCTAVVVQLFYYLLFYLAPCLYHPKEKKASAEPVSVIICARNEAENLARFLPSVLEQDYPSFEVIVVNDCSEDSTDDVLGELLTKYNNLRVSSITRDPKFTHTKKFAQFIGIKAATNELLLLTDADCQPESPLWLSGMVSCFTEKVDFVLGYGGYLKGKGLLANYIRYDTMFIAMQYLGMAIRGIPYMGVGRNLAYRRSLFFRNKGFGKYSSVVSGDDDLFVNTNAHSGNTVTEFSHDTHTRSVPSATVKSWIKKKQRHFTTARFYKPANKILLLLEPLSRIVFYSLLVLLIVFQWNWPIILSIFGVRLIAQETVFYHITKKLNEPGILISSLFYDIFSPLINIILYLSILRSRARKITWK